MSPLRILFVVPRFRSPSNPEEYHEVNYNYIFPLGFAYVVSATKAAGFAPKVINMNHTGGITRNILNKELDKNYDVVCTGGMAINYNEIEAIIKTAKSHPSKPRTILGGLIITAEPKFIFEEIKPDYGVIGEGEITLPELLKHLENGNGNDVEIAGTISWRSGQSYSAAPREEIRDLDKLPRPEFIDLGYGTGPDNPMITDQFSSIVDEPRGYPILGSRGCPFQCTFCYHYCKYRQRSLADLFDELEPAVIKYKLNLVGLYDDCFSLKMDRMEEFCRRIKELRSKIGWDLYWGAQIMVSKLTPEVMGMLKDAGCYVVSLGFESYDKDVLKSMRKPISPAEIDNARRLAFEYKIGLQANFIFGDIAETVKSANTTIQYWSQHCNGQVSLGMVQPYPGSAIYQYCIEKGIIKDKIDFIKNRMLSENTLNFTSGMSDSEHATLHATLAKLLIKSINNAVAYNIKKDTVKTCAMTIKCPYCKSRTTYKRVRVHYKYAFKTRVICRSCRMQLLVYAPLRYFLCRVFNIRYSFYGK